MRYVRGSSPNQHRSTRSPTRSPWRHTDKYRQTTSHMDSHNDGRKKPLEYSKHEVGEYERSNMYNLPSDRRRYNHEPSHVKSSFSGHDTHTTQMVDGKNSSSDVNPLKSLPYYLGIKWYGRPDISEAHSAELDRLKKEAEKLISSELEINSAFSKVNFDISILNQDIENYINEQEILTEMLSELDRSLAVNRA